MGAFSVARLTWQFDHFKDRFETASTQALYGTKACAPDVQERAGTQVCCSKSLPSPTLL